MNEQDDLTLVELAGMTVAEVADKMNVLQEQVAKKDLAITLYNGSVTIGWTSLSLNKEKA